MFISEFVMGQQGLISGRIMVSAKFGIRCVEWDAVFNVLSPFDTVEFALPNQQSA